MSPDDVPPPQPPRYVPTLTEVIPGAQPPVAAPAQAPAAPAAVAPAMPSAADQARATADELLVRLGPDLDRLISEAIGRVLHEQLLGFNGRVQKAVAEVVRDAVAQSLAQGDSPAVDPRGNP